MKCPHGNHELDIPQQVFINAEMYHNHNLVMTNCCGNPVHVSPVTTFNVTTYVGPRTEDDWGNPIQRKRA